MTSDPLDVDDDLPARITGALQHRAAAVAVEDRLDRITDCVEPLSLSGHGHGHYGSGPADRPLPGRRHPAAARAVFAAAAAVVAVALTLALWHRTDQDGLDPVTGPTPSDATIFPVVAPSDLEALGLASADDVTIQRETIAATGPALVLGRLDGDRLSDLATISVVWPAATAGERVTDGGATGSVVLPPVPGAVTQSMGDRSVRLPYGLGGPADLIVWLGPHTAQADIDNVQTFLEDALVVRSVVYASQEGTWATFQQYYADRPEVLDLVDPADLPSSFQVELGVGDRAVADALQGELLAMPGVEQVSPGVSLQRYEWDEAGATITLDVAPGRDLPIEAVIAALTVTPQAAGPPSLSVGGQLPDGLALLAGPAGPVDEPLPWLSLFHGVGSSRIMITRQPNIDPLVVHTRVQVGGRDGYLSESDGGITLTWPIDDQGWWAQLVGTGLTNGQALALANAVTYTDETVWTARYPAQPATTFETAPPPTTVTDVTDDAVVDTTTTQP